MFGRRDRRDLHVEGPLGCLGIGSLPACCVAPASPAASARMSSIAAVTMDRCILCMSRGLRSEGDVRVSPLRGIEQTRQAAAQARRSPRRPSLRMTATSPGYGTLLAGRRSGAVRRASLAVAWDLEVPAVSEVLAHPSVQLVIEPGNSAVAGVFTGRLRPPPRRARPRPGGQVPARRLPSVLRQYRSRSRRSPCDPGRGLRRGAAELERRALAAPGLDESFATIQAFLRERSTGR